MPHWKHCHTCCGWSCNASITQLEWASRQPAANAAAEERWPACQPMSRAVGPSPHIPASADVQVLTLPCPPPLPSPAFPCAPSSPAAEVEAKFAKSAWGQKLSKRSAKAAMSDFDRYKAAVTKMKRSAKVRKAFNALKKSAK